MKDSETDMEAETGPHSLSQKDQDLLLIFDSSGFLSGGIRNVSPREAYHLCKMGALLLDLRRAYMTVFKVPEVPHLRLLPFGQLKDELHGLDKEAVILCIDSVGLNSHEAWVILNEAGFTRIANVAGGIVQWERDNFPMKIDYSEMLTGSCACQLRARKKKK